MPIPAGAGVIAALVHFAAGEPLQVWWYSIIWGGVVCAVAFLMVSTWRYPSFKDLSLIRPRSPLTYLPIIILLYLIWDLSQPVLLGMSLCYALSGIVIRAGGIVRRRLRPQQAETEQRPEHQVG
jgi:CDP-diacylglycerol--serine O-phosphatidyltransferase